MFIRSIGQILLSRLQEPRQFIQVLAGPRQVGKTTLAKQVSEQTQLLTHYASADEPTRHDRIWIEQQWEIGRARAKTSPQGAILILDEIQKIPEWSTIVKHLWDQDTHAQQTLKLVLLGSAPLLIQQGLTESLAGRFELLPVTHWSFTEMQQAFAWTLPQYLYFGGYPGAANLIQDETRWKRYIIDSLIETTISRDILLMNPINKPALLRQLFYLGCEYSGQILSFQKMLGQLHDAGNTTTLAHYLELLSGAGMLTNIPKFSGQIIRQRGSIPKLQVLNTALMSAQMQLTFATAQENSEIWGRFVESAVGAYLVNQSIGTAIKIFYWREGHKEVDFIVQYGKQLLAIEVKSNRRKETLPGMDAFNQHYKPNQMLLVGGQGIQLEEFLQKPLQTWFA